MIKFSVIIPLYNCERYIVECVNSILSQTYPHFEVVIVNDGSTDGSRDIVESYTDSRVRIVNKENGGLLHARLTGLCNAENDYIVFVDSDDRIRPDLLQDLAVRFENGADVAVYKLVAFSENGYSPEPQGLYSNGSAFVAEDRRELLKKLLTSGDINSIVCKSFKKDLIPVAEMEAYPRIAIGEDALFTLHIFERYTRLVYLDNVYYDYRQFSDSMTHKLKDSNYIDNLFRFNLYYSVADKYFDDSRDVVSLIDKLFFKMTISCVANPRFCVESREQYTKFIDLVCDSSLFSEKIKDCYRKQSVVYRIVLKNIMKKRVRILLFMRKVLKILPS